MKTLIITVAGTATRFNRDTEKETLKCLYYKESPDFSLLSQIFTKSSGIDQFIVVGGYLYKDLCQFIDTNLSGYKSSTETVYNPFFKEYGSGYSLLKGIEALPEKDGEIVFVEGDLFFDMEDYQSVLLSDKDVITINREFIRSDKAVALYVDESDQVHYLYDTGHQSLTINEPFKAIYNSAQIWKFKSKSLLLSIVSGLTDAQVKGTNLEIINKYFGELPVKEIEIIPFDQWINCNTVSDYNLVHSILKK